MATQDLLNLALAGALDGQDHNSLSRIFEYALLPAGKLLRPILLLESARCVGGVPEELTQLALAMEYLHVATLVHDDIIDDDDMRRGRPSVQAAFGVPSAILVGDGLIFQTFAALTGPRPSGVTDAAIIAAVGIVASAGLNLCRGQAVEAELAGNLTWTVEEYLWMARLKTGELFESSCKVGAMLGAGLPKWADELGLFGRHLGTAFQIRDDLLAFDSTPELTGKPADSDLQNRRPTLPLLLAYQRAGNTDRRALERAFGLADPGEDTFDQVRWIVETTGARVAAEQHAVELADRARERLSAFPAERSSALDEIADYVCGVKS